MIARTLADSFFNRHDSIRLAANFVCLLANGFRIYFTPLLGGLLTFPSQYLFTIGQFEYLVLDRDRPGFLQGLPCLVVLGNLATVTHHFKYGAFTVYGQTFQTVLL